MKEYKTIKELYGLKECIEWLCQKAIKNNKIANLTYANLTYAYLIGANLTGANLTRANLIGANLTDADLIGANLTYADLTYADLTDANLIGANLTGANLTRADLIGANLSQCIGIFLQKEFLKQFKKTDKGIIVFKAFLNTDFNMPKNWEITENLYLEEVVNFNRTNTCGCGVNFGTLEYIQKNYKNSEHWECLIEWDDVSDIVVPYNTDGKARCARLKLLKKIKELN